MSIKRPREYAAVPARVPDPTKQAILGGMANCYARKGVPQDPGGVGTLVACGDWAQILKNNVSPGKREGVQIQLIESDTVRRADFRRVIGMSLPMRVFSPSAVHTTCGGALNPSFTAQLMFLRLH